MSAAKHTPGPLSDETLMAIWDSTATQDERVLSFGRAVAAEAISLLWVPVAERLPAQGEIVLCKSGAAGKKPQRLVVLKACHPEPGVHDDEEFGWFDESGRDYVWPVTHWASLAAIAKTTGGAQ